LTTSSQFSLSAQEENLPKLFSIGSSDTGARKYH
jgi:hypothetical protein